MADPEEEAKALAEGDADASVDENKVVEDPSVTEENIDSVGAVENQTDAAPSDESSLPTELEPEPEVETLEEPAVGAVAAEETMPEEAAAEEPVLGEAAAEEPVPEEAATEEPVPEEAAAEEPVLEEAAAEEPVPEEVAAEELMAEEAAVLEPMPEEAAAEELMPEEVFAEDLMLEEAAVEELMPEEVAAEEPMLEEMVAEEPLQETVAEEPLQEASEELLEFSEELWEEESTEELIQEVSAAEGPIQEVAVSEELIQEVPVTEEPARGLDAVVKQEEPLAESQDEDLKSQKDSSGVQYLSAEMESSTAGASPLESDVSVGPPTEGSETLADVAAEAQAAGGELRDVFMSQDEPLPGAATEDTATVRVMLHPDIQIFTMNFNMNSTMEQMKQYFAARLKLPPNVLQLMLLGRILENSETLWNLDVKPNDTIQLDLFSLDEEQFPIKASKLLHEYYMPDFITVRVQTDPDTVQDLVISIKRPSFKKPFLGGFRHKETGTEYHNAGSQTIPKKRPEKGYEEFCRSTQTVVERKKVLQTRNDTSTQMTKIGVYVSNITDKLIEPKEYITADEYHARRLEAVIVIQKYFRRWHAINVVKALKEQVRLRLEWEAEEERRLQREKAERLMREYNRRMVPRTRDDFELLYHALELWRLEELERINNTFSGAERKAALCALLEKEAQLIACIGRHKINADEVNLEKAIMSFLEKCAEPKRWKAFDGRTTEMDTQFTLRARELLEIYRSISMKDLPPDERLDVLLTLKHTVKEHECKLTHEIMELIDREADLMMRGVKECNLEGLRKRICTLFLQYIKTPFFNPEVARLLKVPPDPIRLYHNIYFCLGCKRYLPSTDFAISASSHTVGRCRLCCKLDNEARQREAFFKYKRMLRNLRQSEVNYMDGAKIAFVLQLQDLQYMIENFWGSQSALSAWDDLYDMVMVRWDKHQEWSPWNTILLRNDEAESHLKLKDLEKAYEMAFIHRIKHKHMLARNYFSQFPELAKILHKDDKLADPTDLLVTKPITPAPSKSTHKEG
ncbi:hypothetical protein lerEdw1_007468 [Lerista edwardsae]|nr:hypothetical protein lerEdw1_007468 [Lerista edwardsae]